MAIIKYFYKPIFIGTLICVILFYTCKPIFQKDEGLSSLITSNEITLINGHILTSPSRTGNGKYYSCDFSVEAAGSDNLISSSSGKLKLFIPSNFVEAYFPGKLYSKTEYGNSITKNNSKLLFETGCYYSFSGKNLEHGFFVNKCIKSHWPDSILGKLNYIRALFRLHFKRLMYGWGNGGGLILSLLSGSREYTEQETATAFKDAGLSHILALSGMHLSMFSAIAVFLGKKIGRKKLSYIIRIIFLSIFVFFAGFSPSLMRAFICAFMIILGSVAGVEKPDMFIILCFSFLFQSIIKPQHIYNTGFILSYGALAGILLTGKVINLYLTKVFPTALSGSLSASLGAQLFTAPITLKIFGTFCPIGVIASTIISPMILIFIYSGLGLILITLIFPVLQEPSGIFINFQYNVIKNLVIFFSKAPKLSL